MEKTNRNRGGQKGNSNALKNGMHDRNAKYTRSERMKLYRVCKIVLDMINMKQK